MFPTFYKKPNIANNLKHCKAKIVIIDAQKVSILPGGINFKLFFQISSVFISPFSNTGLASKEEGARETNRQASIFKTVSHLNLFSTGKNDI